MSLNKTENLSQNAMQVKKNITGKKQAGNGQKLRC